MTKQKYAELKQKYTDKMMLLYNIFCEEKKQIPYGIFIQALPQWIMTMQPDVYVMNGGDLDICTNIGLERIVNHLDYKYA